MTGVSPPSASKTDKLIVSALRCIRRRFGFDAAFVCDLRDGRRYVQHLEAEHTQFMRRCDAVESGGPTRMADDRLVVSERPRIAVPPAPVAVEARSTRRAHAPIRFSDGCVYGTLCCYSHGVLASLSDSQAEAVQLLADYVSTLLEAEIRQQGEAESALQRIRSVLEDRSFHAVYQPIVRIGDHRIVGYEALTRFTTLPVRPPNVWFAEARQAGLQAALETDAATTALAGLPALPRDTYLSINVSPATLLSRELLDALETRSLDRLMLEVTEHDVVENYAELSSVIAPLRARGMKLAVDDAGAGFASCRHILLLRPDVIKLDSSLVGKIHLDRGSRALAAALVTFAAEMDSEVVAEGVESREQLRHLRDLAVTHVQGYLLGRPETANRLVRVAMRL